MPSAAGPYWRSWAVKEGHHVRAWRALVELASRCRGATLGGGSRPRVMAVASQRGDAKIPLEGETSHRSNRVGNKQDAQGGAYYSKGQ